MDIKEDLADPQSDYMWSRAEHCERELVKLRNFADKLSHVPTATVVSPFFIDKCAMVGCNYAAMHLHEGKTYCYGCLRTFTAFQRKLRKERKWQLNNALLHIAFDSMFPY